MLLNIVELLNLSERLDIALLVPCAVQLYECLEQEQLKMIHLKRTRTGIQTVSPHH